MLKKIVCTVMVLSMFIIPVHAEETLFGAKQLVTNSGFETVTSGAATGWTYGEVSSWEDILVQSEMGNYIAPAKGGAFVEQTVTGVQPYATYECTIKAKSSVENSALIGVSYWHDETPIATYYANNGITPDGNKGEVDTDYSFSYPVIGSEWKELRFTFFVPQAVNAVKIRVGANAAAGNDAALCFDDVKLKEAKNILTNSSFDELVPTRVTGPEKTQLPFMFHKWGTSDVYSDTGYNGTKGAWLLCTKAGGPCYPLISMATGKEYKFSFRFKVEIVDSTGMSDDDKAAALAASGVRIYCETAGVYGKNHLGAKATEEGTWQYASQIINLSKDLGEYLPLSFAIREYGTINANVKIFVDDVKCEVVESEFYFYDNGSETNSLPVSGNTLRVACKHITRETADGNALLLLAIYEETNNVKSLVELAPIAQQTITGGATIPANSFFTELTVPTLDPAKTYYAEAFVFDGVSSLKPLAHKAVLENK